MKYLFKSLVFLIIFTNVLFCQAEREILIKYSSEIKSSSELFNISPRLLASIIYAEHKLNYKVGEKTIDYILAKSGYNSSLGVCQIKVNTAIWIEENINNPESRFYLGEKYKNIINLSKTRDEVVEKLNLPEINILYASCYIAMIKKLWDEELNSFLLKDKRTGIIATLYSLGLIDNKGYIRQPHNNAKMNNLGLLAQEFFDLFNLIIEFPI